METEDEMYIRQAIAIATRGRATGEDPFGALLVIDGHVVYESGDRCVELSDPTAHAELLVISAYCRAEHCFSLESATLYCSTEPCAMCAGAIHWARIGRVVYSVPQKVLQIHSRGRPKTGCEEIINSGNQTSEILGSLLIEEGRVPLDGYPFESKQIRHTNRFGTPHPVD